MSLSPALRAIFPPTTEMRGTGGLRGRCLGFSYGGRLCKAILRGDFVSAKILGFGMIHEQELG